MIDYFIQAIPLLIALAAYFTRLEIKLATMQRDLCWVKKYIDKCQLHSEDPTQ